MNTPHRFLADLPRTPCCRAVSLTLFLIFATGGCYETQWAPLTPAAPLPDVMKVRITPDAAVDGATPDRARDLTLRTPRFEGDSLLVGQTSWGGVSVGRAGSAFWTGRYRIDQVKVAVGREYSRKQTIIAVGTTVVLVGGILAILVHDALKDGFVSFDWGY